MTAGIAATSDGKAWVYEAILGPMDMSGLRQAVADIDEAARNDVVAYCDGLVCRYPAFEL